MVLLSLSGVLTVAAILRSSTWLHLPGIWLTVLALTLSTRAPAGQPRTSLLTLPWLLFAGLSPGISVQLFTWLQATIREEYLLGTALRGDLAWLSGENLQNATGCCNVGKILLHPFGIPLLLALAWLLALRRRRSLVQTLLLGTLGGVGSLLMGAGSVWLVMLLPSLLSTVDGSPSWLFFLLQLAVTLAWCPICLAAVNSVTGPIANSGIRKQKVVNAWTSLWDHLIGGESLNPMSAEYKTLRAVLTKAIWSPWHPPVMDAVWAWWDTRPRIRLGASLLLLLLLCSAPLLTNGKTVLQSATSRVQATADSERPAEQSVTYERALRMLVSLQPAFGQPRLELVQVLLKTGRLEECRQVLSPMITDGPLSWGQARLWLVQNSLESNPLLPLTNEERIRHLQVVMRDAPGNSDAATLLAGFYLEAGERLLAERVLTEAAAADPTNPTLLLKFHSANNLPIPDPQNYERLLQEKRRQFFELPAAERTAARTISLAELLLTLGRIDESFTLVADARQLSDSPELRGLEARIRLRRIAQAGTREFINPQPILNDLESALILAPDSNEALELAILITVTEGARLSDQATDALLNHLSTLPENSVTNGRRALVSLLRADWNEAVAILQKLQSLRTLEPIQQLALVFALRQKSETQQAQLEANRAVEAGGPLLSPERLRQAVLLQVASGNLRMPEQPGVAADSQEFVYCQTLLAQFRFDQLTGYPGDLSSLLAAWQPPADASPAALQLLELPLQHRNTQSAAARRLYRLRRASGGQTAKIDAWLQQIRATLGAPGQLLLIVGTMAVEDEAWDEAIYWLDSALLSTQEPSPAALNNLAIAIIRARRTERYPEALTLIGKAITKVPDNPDLLASRAEICMAMRDWQAALKDLQQILASHPDHPDALKLLPTVKAALNLN